MTDEVLTALRGDLHEDDILPVLRRFYATVTRDPLLAMCDCVMDGAPLFSLVRECLPLVGLRA